MHELIWAWFYDFLEHLTSFDRFNTHNQIHLELCGYCLQNSFYERSMSSRWYIALLYCRNEAEYPRLNLQRWLGLSFVLPPSSDMAQHTTENRECPICYAYLVNDVCEITLVFAWFCLSYKRYYCASTLENLFQIAPDIVCANRQCRRNFHQHCLYIWLKSVPTSRQSFCTVFGICPFCSAPIRCNQISDIMIK